MASSAQEEQEPAPEECDEHTKEDFNMSNVGLSPHGSRLKRTKSAPYLGPIPVVKGDFTKLPKKVQIFVSTYAHLMTPRALCICDGSQEEADDIIRRLVHDGTLTKLTKYKENYLCRTDPADVARVESRTFISTPYKHDTIPHVRQGVKGILAQWMSPHEAQVEVDKRFPRCMRGRMMFVIPFTMGPVGSPLGKIGVQVTDSSYVLLSMRIMTRVTPKVWELLRHDDFVKCVHTIGCPRPFLKPVKNHWPCNPKKLIILHFPEQRKVKSFGSGYGGNSLLGKKCFALRIASVIARDEGWMAEHMLIMGVKTPKNKEYFLTAAFPSGCGKTNLAMMKPLLPGYDVRCIGDDIAWMKFDANGVLHAINPEAGFFGVAPGTNMTTNPNAVLSFQKNSMFTNVAETADGGYFWEGMEKEVPKNMEMINWLGEKWKIGDPGRAAHPNSRFTAPAGQCPIMHPKWDHPDGLPISAIIFGGRRPAGVPLVYEANSWAHGVMIGACIKSEATACAEHTGKVIMHDPMAMRPFFGYNFGHYLQHWLNLETPTRKMPKVFHVNWFRLDSNGKFLWPGFGQNIRVIEWILRRCEGDDSIYVNSPIGRIPRTGSVNTAGLGTIDEIELFSLPKDYWLEDTRESKQFLQDQVGIDTPPIIFKILDEQEEAFSKMKD